MNSDTIFIIFLAMCVSVDESVFVFVCVCMCMCVVVVGVIFGYRYSLNLTVMVRLEPQYDVSPKGSSQCFPRNRLINGKTWSGKGICGLSILLISFIR